MLNIVSRLLIFPNWCGFWEEHSLTFKKASYGGQHVWTSGKFWKRILGVNGQMEKRSYKSLHARLFSSLGHDFGAPNLEIEYFPIKHAL